MEIIAERTIARCNRCNEKHALPRDVEAVRENRRVRRIAVMVTLSCGHCDTHWVHDSDNPTPEATQ